MSRSFVKTWATVATIMALACFSFVLPLPEHPLVTVHQSAAPGANGITSANGTDALNVTPPFVESVLTGKVFSPYLTISSLPLFWNGVSQPFAQAPQLQALRSPSFEPPIRPG
jgi:hypothetical protein